MAEKKRRTRRGSSKRSSRRNYREEERDEKKLNSKGYDNDPNWYFTSAELASQASELSFQEFVGNGNLIGHYSVPQLLDIRFNPSPGNVVAPTEANTIDSTEINQSYDLPNDDAIQYSDGMNLMATKIYTLLSAKSGRTANYAPQDVATMLLAISSIAECIEFIRRLFGVALTYNPRNRAVPRVILGACLKNNGNVNSFLSNIANYRMQFNTEIARINQIPLLDNIGFIRKSREMYQKVYIDENSPMAQLIMYNPESFWIMDEQYSDTGTVLRPVDVYHGNPTMQMLISTLHSMITAVLESTSLNLIYADLINLASKMSVPMWQFDYLTEDYVVLPEYNQNVLLQIHNSVIAGSPWKGDHTSPWTVGNQEFTPGNYVFHDPDNNRLKYNPVFLNNIIPRPILIDMLTPTPTVEDRIESLRFSSTPSGWYIKEDDEYYGAYLALPDHYITSMRSVMITGDTIYFPYSIYSSDFVHDMSVNVSWMQNRFLPETKYDWMDVFSCHPMFYGWTNTYRQSGGAWVDEVDFILSDLNFYTKVDFSYLNRLNRLMCAGLFDFRM